MAFHILLSIVHIASLPESTSNRRIFSKTILSLRLSIARADAAVAEGPELQSEGAIVAGSASMNANTGQGFEEERGSRSVRDGDVDAGKPAWVATIHDH